MKKIILILLSIFGLNAIQAQVLVFKGSKTESEISIPGEGAKPTIGKSVQQTYLVLELDANNRIINLAEIDFNIKAKEYEIWQDSHISPNRMTGAIIGKDRAILTYQDPDNEDNTVPDVLVAEGRVNKGSISSLVFDGRTDLDSMTVKGLPLTAGGKLMTNGIRMGVIDYMSRALGQNSNSTENFNWETNQNYLYVYDPLKNFAWSFVDEYDEWDGWDRNLTRINQKLSDVTKYLNTAQYNIAQFAGTTFTQKIAAVEALLQKQKMVKVNDGN